MHWEQRNPRLDLFDIKNYMKIEVLSGATSDLWAMAAGSPQAAAAVVALLQELSADFSVLEAVTERADIWLGRLRISVAPWRAARERRNNLSRIRILDSPATSFRMIVGFDWRQRRAAVLAVLPKDEHTYEIFSDRGRRIVAEWREFTAGRDT